MPKELFLEKMRSTYSEMQMDELWMQATLKKILIRLQKLGGMPYLHNMFKVIFSF